MGEVSNAFVCLIGIGIVFIGLICIVLLCMLISKVCQLAERNKNENNARHAAARSEAAPIATVSAESVIPSRQEIIAAVSAVIAEELGTEITGIRVLSFKQI